MCEDGPAEQPLLYQSKMRSINLRVDNVPEGTTEEVLQEDIKSLCDNVPTSQAIRTPVIKSLARRNSEYLTATVSFKTFMAAEEAVIALKEALDISDSAINYRFDSSFYGITPLTEPRDALNVCDIIAVPGLGAHGLNSWKSTVSDDVWLRDWLPKDVRNVRVLLYGYNTRLLHDDSLSSIKDLAARFRESVGAFRSSTNTEERPIVYVGHSLGGLLIKDALVQARKSPAEQPLQKSLYKRCLGLVFFGVPHAGVRHEELVALVKGRPNEDLVESIMVNSETEPTAFLSSLSEEFAYCFQGATQVMSWYERKKSPTVVMVNGKLERTGEPRLLVTKYSATRTGLTSVPSENNCVSESDHSVLVRYEWNGDPEYVSVKEKIRSWVEASSPMTAAAVKGGKSLRFAHTCNA